MNPFKNSSDNKRYHTYNYFLKNKYKKKVAKVALNANFTCPNRDGTKGVGGCIYCSSSGSGEFGGDPSKPLLEQFSLGKEVMQRKWPDCGFIPYFQAGTNTYAHLDILKQCFEPFVNRDDVLGISIATRPDCLSDEILDYLEDLNKRTDLCIELGLQTMHESTAKLINRGHDLDCFTMAVKNLRKRNIDICVHIINGLPYETKKDMLKTAQYVSQLDIQFLKIHMLFILDDTPIYELYQNNPFPLLSREDYIDITCSQLELINENVVIERLTGDGDPKHLFYPLWSIKKVTILNDIDKEFVKRNSYQSIHYQK